MTSIRITRPELYELVWKTPMSRLAAEFGVSDVALAKTCDRMSVPRPGRGYWARVAAGMKMRRPPLGKLDAGAQEEWTFVERSESPVPRPPKQEVPKVTVPTGLRDAHDSVRRIGILLSAATKDQHDRLVVAGPREPVLAVTVATHRRALLLLAGIATAAEERGHGMLLRDESGANRLAIVVGDDALGLSIFERLEQKEHMLTPEEAKRAATGYRHGIPKYDSFACGKLQVVLHDVRGARASWSDTKTRILERQLGTVVLAAELEVGRRREARLAEEKRRDEDARRRAAEEVERKRKRLQEARTKHQERLAADLRDMAQAWSDANELRRFIEAVRDALPAAARTERANAWLRWADACATAVDPLTHVTEIPKELDPTEEQLLGGE